MSEPADERDPLLEELARALEPERREPDPGRVAALRDAAAARGPAGVGGTAGAERRPSRRPLARRRPAWALRGALVAALIGAALVVGNLLDDDDGGGVSGTVEYAGPIEGPGGEGSLDITEAGIGRVVELSSDDLEILPKGEFYELWFVGPGDSPEDPNRISAGTFHPDAEGRSEITLTAAVDPSLYPVVSVTAEPGDGNPRATGPEVLRTEIE